MRPFLHRYGAHCSAEQVDITEGCPKMDLFTFKGHDRELHNRLVIMSRAKGEYETILGCLCLSDFL